MTDKEKLTEIIAEIERLKGIAVFQLDNCKVDRSAWSQQAEVCKRLLSFISSMPEEPKFKVGQTITDPTDPIFTVRINKIEEGKYIERDDIWVSIPHADEEYRLVEDSNELAHSVTKISNQEPVSEELEKELERIETDTDIFCQRLDSLENEEWANDIAAEYGIKCFKKGMKWQKEQLIKSAKLEGWIARDEDDRLHLFEVEPRRLEKEHRWWDRDYHATSLDESDFPDLKWEDDPVYVKLPIIVED